MTMDGTDAAPPIPLERAVRRVREAAWATIVPLPCVAVWWVVLPFLLMPPPGATRGWETALRLWGVGWETPIPFALAVMTMFLGPTVSLAAGVIVLRRLRRDRPRVPAACSLAAALSLVSMATAPWVSVAYGWTESLPGGGSQSASVNFSPSLCCGGWHLLVAGWLAFAAIRYAPVFRDAAGAGE